MNPSYQLLAHWISIASFFHRIPIPEHPIAGATGIDIIIFRVSGRDHKHMDRALYPDDL